MCYPLSFFTYDNARDCHCVNKYRKHRRDECANAARLRSIGGTRYAEKVPRHGPATILPLLVQYATLPVGAALYIPPTCRAFTVSSGHNVTVQRYGFSVPGPS